MSKDLPKPNNSPTELPAVDEPSPHDPFGWDDEELETRHSQVALQGRSQQAGRWILFWIATWAGTTIAGGLFGGLIGLAGASSGSFALLDALLFGLIWAGSVGLFVYLHIGVFCWTFWWLGRPLKIAMVAGLATGAICGLVLLSIFTAPLGLLGAYVTGSLFLETDTGKRFQATIEFTQNNSLGRLRFSTTDLLLRMTAISVLIAGWSAWYKSVT